MIRKLCVDLVMVIALCMVVWGCMPVWAACLCVETIEGTCEDGDEVIVINGNEGYACVATPVCGSRSFLWWGPYICKCETRPLFSWGGPKWGCRCWG